MGQVLQILDVSWHSHHISPKFGYDIKNHVQKLSFGFVEKKRCNRVFNNFKNFLMNLVKSSRLTTHLSKSMKIPL
jgi:hypothetical protein